MKKIIALIAFVFCCTLGNVYAQQNTIFPSKTSVTGGRYEILQSNNYHILLLDKHEGRVWEGDYDTFIAIPVEGHEEQLSKIDTTQINYQVYVSESIYKCLLVNIHSGETWCFSRSDKQPNWRFKKIVTP